MAYTIMCDDHGALRHGVPTGWRLRVALWWYGLRHQRCCTTDCPGVYGQLDDARRWIAETKERGGLYEYTIFHRGQNKGE